MEQTEPGTHAPPAPAAERYRRLMAIYEEAIEVRGNEREWFLSVRCADDTALKAEVAAMLRNSDLAQAPIATGAGLSPALAAGDVVQQTPPKNFTPVAVLQGHYRIIRAVGEGGMGVVYEAEQTIPRRPVAIKAIRPGIASRQMLRRFEREAHILGRLQHPGIAQIFEAGAATSAQADEAYFVMEFVDGSPITDYADNAGLSVAARLELLAKACDAVHHAHQRRVIHRDLKPGNILVTKDGQPKILDFGVARLDASDEEQSITRHTQAGQLIGTLSYMAPEQLLGEEVDVRADVYSLGVVLYQLLAHRLPHDLSGKSLPEAAMVISQDEPARLSTIDHHLRGDIDVIVQKAMERGRERRYQSAADLAADIRRHLRAEPILARGDSAVYVLRKQISRHRTLAVAVLLALLSLAGFAVYAGVQSSREAAAKNRVEQLYEEAQAERVRADANAEHYRAELRNNSIERGRLLGITGNFHLAEQMIWKEHLASPSDLSHWALWELYSKMPVRASLLGHTDAVIGVAASPDGKLAATAGDTTIRLWNTTDWTLRTVIETHAHQSRGVRFTPDSRFVLQASTDGTLGIWDAQTGAPVHSFDAKEQVYSIAIAPGEAPWPVVARCLSGIRIFSLDAAGSWKETGRLGPELKSASSDWTPVAINTTRTLAAAFTNGATRVWRLDTNPPEEVWSTTEHPGSVTALAFSPDGTTLACGTTERVAFFWDVSGTTITPSTRHTLKWDNGSFRSLDFTKDGRYLVSAGYWRVEVLDVAERARAKGFAGCEETSRWAVWLPDDNGILAGAVGNVARVWEAHPNNQLRKIEAHKTIIAGLAISPDSTMVASAAVDGSIRLWKWPGMEPIGDLTGHTARVRYISFSHDGHKLVSGSADRTIRVWNLSTRECTLTIPDGAYEYYATAFSPDDRLIVTGIRDSSVRTYDAQSGKLTDTFTSDYTADGTVAASFADNNTILWVHGRMLSSTVAGKTADMTMESAGWTLGLLPEAHQAAVGCWGGSIYLWDLDTHTKVRELIGHTQVVTSVAVGPVLSDGTRALASSSAEGLIKLWSTTTGACLLTLSPDAGQIMRLVSTPDGRWLISAHDDGTLGIWDLSYYEAHIKAAEPLQMPPSQPPAPPSPLPQR